MFVEAPSMTPLIRIALIGLAVCLTACQSYRPLGAADADGLGLDLRGQALLQVPVVETPVWVVFAVDCSGSMAENDSGWGGQPPARIRAIRELLDGHADRPDMRWAVIRFGSLPQILTQRDTDGDGVADRFLMPDGPDLRDSLDGLLDARGWTSYLEALDLARDTLRGELVHAPEDAGQTRVQVVLLSDDGDQPLDVGDPAGMGALLDRIDRLTALGDPGVLGQVRVHVAQLSPFEEVSGGLVVPAPNQEVLEAIARAGGGSYKRFKTPDALSFSHLDVRATAHRPLDGPVRVLVANLSALPGPDGPRPDSDSDGVADDDELEAGTDPLRADTDADGYPDGVERALGPAFDPLTPNACPTDSDSDGDGLLACAEAQLGTDATRVDTDADGLPDPLELWAGTDPLSSQPGLLPAGIYEARVQRTPSPQTNTELVTFRLDGLPEAITLQETNSVQVWLAGPGGLFRQACLATKPWEAFAPIELSDEDLGPPGRVHSVAAPSRPGRGRNRHQPTNGQNCDALEARHGLIALDPTPMFHSIIRVAVRKVSSERLREQKQKDRSGIPQGRSG